MLEHPICAACGTRFPEGPPPPSCPICEDPRQYVPRGGQQWTTPAALAAHHHNEWTEEEPGVTAIHTRPDFAIGQRAFLIQTPEGNLLWDAVALLDAETIARVRDLGGLRAIAISHPHYYSAMAAWSESFDGVPVYLHEADRAWVMEPCPGVRFWSGTSLPLFGGLQLVHTGGHFDGFQVCFLERGKGVLFAGDQPQVAMDRNWVSFLWSYPNMVPLGPRAVRQCVERLRPLAYDRLYGAFGRHVPTGAREVVERSAARYLRMIEDA